MEEFTGINRTHICTKKKRILIQVCVLQLELKVVRKLWLDLFAIMKPRNRVARRNHHKLRSKPECSKQQIEQNPANESKITSNLHKMMRKMLLTQKQPASSFRSEKQNLEKKTTRIVLQEAMNEAKNAAAPEKHTTMLLQLQIPPHEAAG